MGTYVKFSGGPMSIDANTTIATFVRISALSWADRFAAFAVYMLMNYLTNVWKLSTVHAAGIINIWNGITPICAIVFLFFVDAFTGDFLMLVVSSIAYCIGLGLLTMSTPPVFGPCKDYEKECVGHSKKVLFYTALPLIAVGMAGRLVSEVPFLVQQSKSENEIEIEKRNKKEVQLSISESENEIAIQIESEKRNKKENENENQNENKCGKANKLCRKTLGWTMLIIVIAGCIGLSYVKSWSLRFGIPTICSVVAILLFFSGWLDYKHIDPQGSPLTATFRVFVVTARNFSKPIPDPLELYNEDDTRSTSSLRCFDKAAIKLPEEQQLNRWNVCNVREVEETKIGIRILPIWLTFIVIGIVLSIGNTYYLEQAKNMDKTLGKIKVHIPSLLIFYGVASSIFTGLYSFLATRIKLYTPPIGIATSMFLSVLCCITAAKVETRRLHRIRDHGLLDKPEEEIPMSIFALLPQLMLLGAVDGIAKKSITGFFTNQAPASLRKYLIYFTKGVLGLGSMASVLSVYVVGKVSERNGRPNWFQETLNKCRMDKYYWVLAALSAFNLVIYVIIAYFYNYWGPPKDDDNADGDGELEIVQI